MLKAELPMPHRLLNVSVCVEAGLYNSQPVITKVYREGSCQSQFYMTVIGKIIGDSKGGWIGKIKVVTIFILVMWNQPTSIIVHVKPTSILFIVKPI